jgi:Carboxypeptidase regulatory-like domain
MQLPSLYSRTLYRAALAALLAFLISAVATQAQYTTGSVQGTVLDQNGAVVPNATVTLLNLDTGVSHTFNTGQDGIYFFTAVPIGRYEVSTEVTGFAKYIAQLTVAASTTATQDIKLALQGQATTVVVTAESVVEVDKTDSQEATTRNALEVDNLPSGDSALGLITVAPGVTPMYNPRGGGSLVKLSGAQTGSISAGGGRAEYGASELDFTDANDWEFGGIAPGTYLDPDFVGQLNVLTSNISAEYGLKSSGIIETITKSGTNQWHGEASDYIQNGAFNARDYNDQTGHADFTNVNNYGFSMGGPVIKNKLWVFGGWHRNKTLGAGSTYDAPVPTAAADATATDPGVISIIKQYFPTPTLPLVVNGVTSTEVGLFPVQFSSPGLSYDFIIRGDYQFSPTNTLSVRYFQSTGTFVLPFVGALVAFANEGSGFDSQARNANITDTWTINNSTTNQARIAYARSVGALPSQDPNPGPYFFVGGLTPFGEYGGFPQGRVFDIYQGNDVLTKVLGRHTLNFGFDARFVQDNSFNAGTFGSFTRGFFDFADVPSFLAGNLAEYEQLFGPSTEPFRTRIFSTFAQDDWHVRPDLIVNLGLRWEYQGAIRVAGGKYSLLDPDLPGDIGAAGTGPLGSFKVGNPVVNKNPFNMAPRLGFAWNPHQGPLVVRGGYGIYYDTFYFTPLADEGRTSPPVAVNGVLTNFTGGNTLDALLNGNAPFQTQLKAQQATGGFGTTTNFGNITTTDPNMRNPYVQEYDLFLDYSLTKSLVVTAGYVGSKGTHLGAFVPVNNYLPSKLAAIGAQPATSVADETARLANFQTAFSEEGTGMLREDPRFAQVNLITNEANSNYNSLQLIARQSLSHGLMFQFSYTRSKSLDDASTAYPQQDYLGDGVAQDTRNIRTAYAVSNFDIPNVFQLTGIWQLPFFRNRTDWPSRILLKGWEFSSVNTYQSGVPFNVFAGAAEGPPAVQAIADVNLDGNTSNGGVVGDNTLANCVTDGSGLALPHGFSSKYTFTMPLLGNNGNCGRNIAREPGLLNFNWAFTKNVELFENGPLGSGPWNLQFRTEVYNVLNNPSFYVANASSLLVSSPATFGALTALPQRKLTLAIRLMW